MNFCVAHNDLQLFLPLGGAYISLLSMPVFPLLWLFASHVDLITTAQSAQLNASFQNSSRLFTKLKTKQKNNSAK